MFNKRSPIIAGLLLAGISIALWCWFTSALNQEPLHNNLPVRWWVDLAAGTGISSPEDFPVDLQTLAPMALPHILPRLAAPDRLGHKIWSAVWPRLPGPLMIALPAPDKTSGKRFEALRLLPLLGSNALPALPILLKLAKETNSYDSVLAIKALGAIGPPAGEAEPMLMSMLNTNHGEAVRIFAAESLWLITGRTHEPLAALMALAGQTNDAAVCAVGPLKSMGPAALPAVPVLIQLTRDTRIADWARAEASIILGNLRIESPEAISALEIAARGSDVWLRLNAAKSLAKIDPARRPILLAEALAALKTASRSLPLAVESVGEFGTEAAAAAPDLRRLAESVAEPFRSKVVAALHSITNSAARPPH